MRRFAVMTILLAAAAGFLYSQSTKKQDGDWPMYNRDLAGTRFSPLTQITTGNVAKLRQVWSYRLRPANFRFATAGGAAEVVPIVMNGVMYISTQSRIVALGPRHRKGDLELRCAGRRSVAQRRHVLAGRPAKFARILFTAGARLQALNAVTGEVSTGFGKEGAVDMVVAYDGVPPASSRT